MNRRQFITTAVGAAAAVAACPVIASPPPIDERLTRMFSHLHPGAVWRLLAVKSPHYIFVSRKDQRGTRIVDVSAQGAGSRCGVPGALLTPTAEEMLQKYPGAHLSCVSWGRNVRCVPRSDQAPTYVQASLYCELRYVLPDQTLFKVEYGEPSETSYGTSYITAAEEKWEDAPNVRLAGFGVDAVLEQLAIAWNSGIDWSAS